jgi:hypothetical protein
MHALSQLQNGELKGATALELTEELTHFPPEIFELEESLEYLDLSGNRLTALPADFGRLKKLKIIFCSGNRFTALPEVLADCPLLELAGFKNNQISTIPAQALNTNLKWLILTNNKVEALPPEIGNCHRLQKLMLAGNQLTALPQEVSRCKSLGLLRVAANSLTALPDWLFTMPNLAWLAFAGNAFNAKPQLPPLTLLNWDSFNITSLIGEGASGLVYKATDLNGREVAIKVFKGNITSDGFPEDEIAVCLMAGKHPGLVNLVGQITGHPEGKKGLVMDLIPPVFYNLGMPPSMETCTRDVFKPGLKLSAKSLFKIAGTVAAVAAQLHANGIMHSDMYAHNILTDNDGNALFSDFGASCFYDKNDAAVAPWLERIEVRAFGYLLDDLINLRDENTTALQRLRKLRDECLATEIAARPSFKLINQALADTV